MFVLCVSGTTCVNATFSRKLKEWFHGNWSYSTAFYPGESPFATAFENRVKQAMGLLPENGGKFQITSYPLNIGKYFLEAYGQRSLFSVSVYTRMFKKLVRRNAFDKKKKQCS